MDRLPDRVDVAIAGAGTAGAAAAAACAALGLRVLCIDSGPLERAGARWVNGVPGWAFDAAGFERPRGEELRGGGDPFHLVAGYGPNRLLLREHGVLEVDMRLLVGRLQRLARRRGALLAGEVRARGVEGDLLRTDAGDVAARWTVDASGLSGARLLGQPRVRRRDLCAAAQEVRGCRDRRAARAFFARHQTPLGETLCFTGVAGGYSILNVRSDGEHVSLLTGSVPAEGQPSGRSILRGFAAEQPWVGELSFGGSRAVPIRRPLDELARGRVALLGDAGCQVFPAHGSGIGAGLVAARVLADALAGGRGPLGYAVAWQRRFGGLLASYDLFRRLSQRLTAEDQARMMRSGLLDPALARAGLAQEPPRVDLRALPRKLRALAGEPRLAARLADAAARAASARLLYARYPERPASLPTWSARVARLFGDPPDVAAR